MKHFSHYYSVLNLRPGSSKEEIKKAYRQLARQWHPDKFLNHPDQSQAARAKFELIQEAYEHLLHSNFTESPDIDPRATVRPTSAKDYYDQGSAYLTAGSYQQAVESFTQAIRKKTDYLEAYQARAFVLEELGLNVQAQADLAKVTQLQQDIYSTSPPTTIVTNSPVDAEVYFQRGLAKFKARKYGAAIEDFTWTIQIDPTHREAYRYRSQAYFQRGYDEQADADFKQMLALEQPNQQPSHSTHFSETSSPVSTKWRCTYTLSGHKAVVSAVVFTKDGKRLISGSHDQTLKLWNMQTGRLLKTLNGHTKAVYCLAVSGDGQYVASGSADKTIKLWDIRTGKLIRTLGGLFSGHSETVTALAFSPDNQSLVSSSLDKTVRFWDLRSGKESYTLTNHQKPILSLALSEDGKTIAYGGEGHHLNLHSIKTGKRAQTLSVKDKSIFSIALSQNNALMAAGSSEEIALWYWLQKMKMISLKGHSQAVTTLSFSADSCRLLSGSRDQTLKLWNTETGENTNTLTGHQGTICSVAYSLDNTRIASGSTDTTIKVWQQV